VVPNYFSWKSCEAKRNRDLESAVIGFLEILRVLPDNGSKSNGPVQKKKEWTETGYKK
jgi:hypothetical protein